MILPRRKFLIGAAASLLAAPAIVRAGSLMPVKSLPEPDVFVCWRNIMTGEVVRMAGFVPPPLRCDSWYEAVLYSGSKPGA